MAIKQILGETFIQKNIHADLHEATDFAIFTVYPFKVGVRLRRYLYYMKWPQQITIRWSRPTGTPTEIDKIKQDYVQYLFYGFVDALEQHLVQYVIVKSEPFKHIKPHNIRLNYPYDSSFAIYNLDQVSDSIIKFWKSPLIEPL